MSVRKAHNSGRNHERNVLDYYQRISILSLCFSLPIFQQSERSKLTANVCPPEIGHEKAQSVIDSITSSYAAEGQAGANPMLAPQGGPPAGGQGFPPPPFGFPGTFAKFSTILYSSPSLPLPLSQIVPESP